MDAKSPKIALVADMLLTPTGSEQLFYYMVQAFPDADIYTLAYNAENTLPEFKRYKIHQHCLHWLFSTPSRFKMLFVLATILMRNWSVGDYDVVLISSATTAKYLRKGRGVHICYCFIPTRALWQSDVYFLGSRPGLVMSIFQFLLPWMKHNDKVAATRIDRFFAISETSRSAIRDIYGRESEVLPCPIPLERFRGAMKEEKKDFYLLVSRLEKWKTLDHAVEAFTKLGSRSLLVVGEGEEEQKLKSVAGSNVTFLGKLGVDELVALYGQARAIIFPSATEYGLVPIEAAAAGTPSIVLAYGGVLETMVGVGEEAVKGLPVTTVFYKEQTAEAVMAAVKQFEQLSFDRAALSEYADKFSVPKFQERLRQLVKEWA